MSKQVGYWYIYFLIVDVSWLSDRIYKTEMPVLWKISFHMCQRAGVGVGGARLYVCDCECPLECCLCMAQLLIFDSRIKYQSYACRNSSSFLTRSKFQHPLCTTHIHRKHAHTHTHLPANNMHMRSYWLTHAHAHIEGDWKLTSYFIYYGHPHLVKNIVIGTSCMK